MIKLFKSVCIEAPVELVWARLAKIEDIQLWSPAVIRARCEGPLSQGVGAERTCDLPGRITLKEHWIAWDEGRSFKYEGFGLPTIKRAANLWSVSPEGNKTLLTSEAELEFKWGIIGRLLDLVMAPVIRRQSRNALAPFKYFVENGHPYKGETAELPMSPAIC